MTMKKLNLAKLEKFSGGVGPDIGCGTAAAVAVILGAFGGIGGALVGAYLIYDNCYR